MPRRAEGPRDAIWCRETARSYGVQRDLVVLRRLLRPARAPVDALSATDDRR